jgi:hypothetical protein
MSLACPWPVAEFFPDLCRSIDIYCERTSGAFDAEPVNALTNIGFLIAAAAAWRLQSVRLNEDARMLIHALCATMVAIGFGSFLFHTVGTAWASWADVIPILIFMLIYLWLALTRFFGWSASPAMAALVIFFAVTFSIEAAIPSRILWGGAYYLPTLLVLVIVAVALYRRGSPAGPAMLAAALVFICAFTARTLDAVVCPAFPLGTHFLWHLFNALLLYLLTRAAILYAPSRK